MTSVSARLCFCQAETANMEQFLLSVGLLHAMGHADCGASTGDVSRSWSGALGGYKSPFKVGANCVRVKVDIFLDES